MGVFAFYSNCKGGLFSSYMSFGVCLCHEPFFFITIKFHLSIFLPFITGWSRFIVTLSGMIVNCESQNNSSSWSTAGCSKQLRVPLLQTDLQGAACARLRREMSSNTRSQIQLKMVTLHPDQECLHSWYKLTYSCCKRGNKEGREGNLGFSFSTLCGWKGLVKFAWHRLKEGLAIGILGKDLSWKVLLLHSKVNCFK